MNLTPCPSCSGFVPERHDSCPHCDQAVKPGAIAKAAAAGAMAMTLMACYGAGYDGPLESEWPQTPGEACELATDLVASDGEAYASAATDDYQASDALASPCASTSGPERVYRYDPGNALGQAGTVTILWDSPTAHSVYLADSCGDASALACAPPEASGRLEMSVTSLEPFHIVVDAASHYEGDVFELQVVFEPAP